MRRIALRTKGTTAAETTDEAMRDTVRKEYRYATLEPSKPGQAFKVLCASALKDK